MRDKISAADKVSQMEPRFPTTTQTSQSDTSFRIKQNYNFGGADYNGSATKTSKNSPTPLKFSHHIRQHNKHSPSTVLRQNRFKVKVTSNLKIAIASKQRIKTRPFDSDFVHLLPFIFSTGFKSAFRSLCSCFLSRQLVFTEITVFWIRCIFSHFLLFSGFPAHFKYESMRQISSCGCVGFRNVSCWRFSVDAIFAGVCKLAELPAY